MKEYRDCPIYTHQCLPSAHYNKNLGARINTIPCCRKLLIELLGHITTELKLVNATHLLSFGGVIGWIRYQGIVPYDQDLDIILDKSFWISNLFWIFLERLNTLYGHTYEFSNEGKKTNIFYSAQNRITLSIWPYQIEKEKVKVHYGSWKPQPVYNVFPAKLVIFEDIMTYVPRKPKRYLDKLFGKGNWSKEFTCKHVDTEKEKCLT